MNIFTCVALFLLAPSVIGNRAIHSGTEILSDIVVNRAIHTPKFLFVGKANGDILRCLHKIPNMCEMFYSDENSGDRVQAIVLSGEYLYASFFTGVMLRCNLYEKNSCTTFNQVGPTEALVIAAGNIYAGIDTGLIVKCQLHQPHTCKPFYNFTSGITCLAAREKHIYVGLESRQIWLCNTVTKQRCRLYNDGLAFGSSIRCLSPVYDAPVGIVGITSGGTAWNCTRHHCSAKTAPGSNYSSMAIFDGSLYTLQGPNVWMVKWYPKFDYSLHSKQKDAVSIAFAYSTYKMQSQFINEGKSCVSDVRCPPYMSYYPINKRSVFEVFVKGGKLYNSRGKLVDTSKADVGHSGRVAIFAMGVDGQILLSNVHYDVLCTSSLFAGNPVAGTGEMVVKDGIIKSIMACSDHYLPDVGLNQQVINALSWKGYNGHRIESLPCCNGNKCHLNFTSVEEGIGI